jgi:3-hydroxyacyl-CoA dehydrogenase
MYTCVCLQLVAQPFRKADFVIEAAPEDEEIKKTIFRKLDQVSLFRWIQDYRTVISQNN